MYQARKLHARTGCGQPKLDLVCSSSHPGWAPQQRTESVTDAPRQWTLLEQSNTCTTFYWEYFNVHVSPFCQFNQGNTSRTFSHKRGFQFFPPGQTFNREKYTIHQILHSVVAVGASLSSQLKCSILRLKTLPPGKNFTSSCFSFVLCLATTSQGWTLSKQDNSHVSNLKAHIMSYFMFVQFVCSHHGNTWYE